MNVISVTVRKEMLAELFLVDQTWLSATEHHCICNNFELVHMNKNESIAHISKYCTSDIRLDDALCWVYLIHWEKYGMAKGRKKEWERETE